MKKQLDVALDNIARIELISPLRETGHHVTFVTGYRSEKSDFGLGDSIVYLDASPVPGLHHHTFVNALASAMPGLVARFEPDAVILDAWTVKPLLRWLASLPEDTRPVVVADIRTLPVNQRGLRGWLVERQFDEGVRLMNTLDGVTVITPAMREVLLSRGLLDPQLPWSVWTSGVDLARFAPEATAPERRREIRDELSPEGEFVLMYHGAITRERGIPELIEAATRVRRDGRSLRLVLLGDGRDRAEILAEATARGSGDVLTYIPSVASELVPEYVSAADAGAIPLPDTVGWRVSSPLKLLEYWASAKPVVMTDIQAHRFAAHGCEGHVFAESSDPAALASAIERLVDMPVAERMRLGRAGRECAEERFGLEVLAAGLVGFLARVEKRPTLGRGSRG
jgi:glycosyltransferase involved in cell wall biosynthesis